LVTIATSAVVGSDSVPKVFIYEPCGYGNPGDEACLKVIIGYLKKFGFQIWANSFHPEITRKLGIDAIYRNSINHPLDNGILSKIDVLR